MKPELKFGHRVIAYYDDKSDAMRGRYISYINNELEYSHNVLLDGEQITTVFSHVELDPDATEFLRGDEVEMSDNGEDWVRKRYGYDWKNNRHVDYDEGLRWFYCRYPRKDALHGKTAIIDGKEYELRLK